MTARHYIGIVAAMVLSCLDCSAEAQPSRVDPAQVCAVQHAIRWRTNAWTGPHCAWIADALNKTSDSWTFFAMMINESDMRERAQRVTVLPDGKLARDIGLLAVRCVTSPGSNLFGECLNGAVRGMHPYQLFDGPTNIEAAERVLATHGGSLDGYNGCVQKRGRRCRYGENIAALVSALGGVEVKVRGARLRKLVRQVVEAINGRKQS